MAELVVISRRKIGTSKATDPTRSYIASAYSVIDCTEIGGGLVLGGGAQPILERVNCSDAVAINISQDSNVIILQRAGDFDELDIDEAKTIRDAIKARFPNIRLNTLSRAALIKIVRSIVAT